jgi:hypothetical protein
MQTVSTVANTNRTICYNAIATPIEKIRSISAYIGFALTAKHRGFRGAAPIHKSGPIIPTLQAANEQRQVSQGQLPLMGAPDYGKRY